MTAPMITKHLPFFDLAQIAASGQCFRLNTDRNRYTAVHRGFFAEIEQDGTETHFFCSEDDFENVWKDYFDLDTDYGLFQSSVYGDSFLEKAAEFGKGIRILRQDPWEMICTFIISQNRNIPAIRKSVEALCRLFGELCRCGDRTYYTFPSAERLHTLNAREREAFRTQASLGYRDKFIVQAAAEVAEKRFSPEEAALLPNDALYRRLTALCGVGPKVASCIMLYGFHRLDSFPVDVWIKRIVDEVYGGVFDPARHEGFQGVIQQYMFYYYRSLRQKNASLPETDKALFKTD